MNKYGLSFHHLGLAVSAPEMARKFLAGCGYVCGAEILDTLQNVHLAMCTHSAMPAVEIIFPAEGSGPLSRLLKKHRDGLVYHVCYETLSLYDAISSMEADGLRLVCVSPPTKAVLFGGKEVSFYLIVDVGLIEIIDLGS